jgi:hypothetical protein
LRELEYIKNGQFLAHQVIIIESCQQSSISSLASDMLCPILKSDKGKMTKKNKKKKRKKEKERKKKLLYS